MNAPNFDGDKALDGGLVEAEEGVAGHSENHRGPEHHNGTLHRESSSAAAELYAQSGDTPSSRRAILRRKDTKEVRAIDLDGHIDEDDRKSLLMRALGTEQADAEGMLNKIRARFDAVGYEVPTVEVRFEDLHITTSVYSTAARNVPNIINAYRDIFEYAFLKSGIYRPKKTKMAILNHVTSVLRPGRCTLLLGPPAAGKSTLLKSLAGKMENISSVKKTGVITYNGRTFDEFLPQTASVYIEQEDQHLPELTVRETMDFSALCQGAGHKKGEVEHIRALEKEKGVVPDWDVNAYMLVDAKEKQQNSIATDYTLRMLGLEQAADTIIGNADIRGISGGQKKRVTTAEMIVGPKKVIFADEISTGLDSSTTYEIVKFMGDTCAALGNTTLIALLQPAPETFELFTDVMLLSEGYLVYHGPRKGIEDFFADLGFVCPERKGVADFLQEVTSKKDQKQYWSGELGPYKYLSVAEMAERFKESTYGREIQDHMSKEIVKAEVGSKHHGQEELLRSNRYALSNRDLFWFCWARELTLARRNLFVYGFRFFVTMFMGFVTATLFIRTEFSADSVANGNLYFGMIFFSSIMLLFDGFAEETLTVQRIPGFFKQRDNMFYSAAAYVFPTTIIRIPYSLLCATLWSVITYYPVGLAPEASRFFFFLFMLFLLHSMGIAMFRCIASICRNETVASTGGSFFFLVLLLLGGFLLARGDIPGWWIWFYWINPISYATQAIAINEFLAPRWASVPATGYANAGIAILRQRGIHVDDWWRWLGVGCTIIGWAAFNIGCWLAHGYLDPLEGHTATLRPEDTEDEVIEGDKSNAPSRKSLENGDVETGTVPSARHVSTTAPSASPPSLSQLMASRRSVVPENGNPAVSGRSIGVDSNLSGNVPLADQSGMVLPFTPLNLSFHHLNYYVPLSKDVAEAESKKLNNRIGQHDGKDMLQLLRDCSGSFRPGILTALVGSSGAGKTTLMDVLAGRKTTGVIEGDIRVSGHPKVQKTFARVMGYCEQTDIHSPNITVFESLQFSAALRFSKDVEKDIVAAFVEEVLKLVELEPVRGNIVGKPGESGLSVEQRKRLTIAVELVANPSVVFMDEPTSGLDARAAAIVMRTVRNTVNTGRTVVCTIHQP
eukprot:CAMPEP_0206141786 /NCGR_PEP_ID=MMETSP1473-20131121/14100_1 /ASSEMBLY_ACC=CAM_ASM_001109 /TAXON_ID=1461547 /ORGANISM="Stichococcus sp, Strain RCC1054" /LENGTH=1124 /DNA_ID=CAMNT_0053536477 /DNA_START=231 /DNA_END=3601 /DNA_ORIENTATION=+